MLLGESETLELAGHQQKRRQGRCWELSVLSFAFALCHCSCLRGRTSTTSGEIAGQHVSCHSHTWDPGHLAPTTLFQGPSDPFHTPATASSPVFQEACLLPHGYAFSTLQALSVLPASVPLLTLTQLPEMPVPSRFSPSSKGPASLASSVKPPPLPRGIPSQSLRLGVGYSVPSKSVHLTCSALSLTTGICLSPLSCGAKDHITWPVDELAGRLAGWETFQRGEVVGTVLFILQRQLVGHILEKEVVSLHSL